VAKKHQPTEPLPNAREEALCQLLADGQELHPAALSAGYKLVADAAKAQALPRVALRLRHLQERAEALDDKRPCDLREIQVTLSLMVRDPGRQDKTRIDAARALHGMLDPHASAKETPVQDLIELAEEDKRTHGATPDSYDEWLEETRSAASAHEADDG